MRYIVIAVLTLISLVAEAQGIEFFNGTWEEAVLKAKEEDRIIFVDAYAVWCGPCKRMAANTFPDPEVGELFNANFINMKIDAEKGIGLDFRQKFPVSAFPTLFFISADQEVIQKVVGAKGPADLIQLAQTVLAKYDNSHKYAEAYEAGDRSYDLVYKYVAALNKAGKSSVKVSNDYLASQSDLGTEENLKLILEAATQFDCQCFELLEEHKSKIIKLTSAEAVDQKIRTAAANTVQRAIEFESEELMSLVEKTMDKHLSGEADAFMAKSRIDYALQLQQLSGIESLVNTYVRKHIKNDPDALNALALQLEKYGQRDPICLNLALDAASKAAKSEDPKHIFTYASLVYKVQGKAEAVRILEEALRNVSEEEKDKDIKNLRGLLNKIENS